MTMRATCDMNIAHDDTVIHQFCEDCEFQTFSASELASVERADFHMALFPIGAHTIRLCGDGRQY